MGSAPMSGAPSVALSAGATAGDLAILIHSSERGSATSIQAPTGGGTWTERVFIEQGAYNNVGKMWTAPVTATGTFSVTTTAEANNPIYAFLIIMSDAVLDVAAGLGFNGVPTLPTVTATASGSFLLGHILYGDVRPGATDPAGMTNLGYTADSGNQGAAQTWYQNNVGPGSTGGGTAGGIANTSGLSMAVVVMSATPPAPTNKPAAFMSFF